MQFARQGRVFQHRVFFCVVVRLRSGSLFSTSNSNWRGCRRRFNDVFLFLDRLQLFCRRRPIEKSPNSIPQHQRAQTQLKREPDLRNRSFLLRFAMKPEIRLAIAHYVRIGSFSPEQEQRFNVLRAFFLSFKKKRKKRFSTQTSNRQFQQARASIDPKQRERWIIFRLPGR